jgi:PEP-CTERM motif-containing protein
MRRKLTCFAWFLVALLGVGISRVSYADTVRMVFTGVGGASAGGYYIYPYYFDIYNQSKTNLLASHVPLMCLSFDREIYQTNPPETWLVTRETAAAADAGDNSHRYEEAAYFLSFAKNNPTEAGDAQLAAWDLFDPQPSLETAGEQAFMAAFNKANVNLNLYANDPVYLALNGTESNGYPIPQNFVGLGPVPEPGTWALLGSGLMGIVAMLYFRKRSQTHAGQLGF